VVEKFMRALSFNKLWDTFAFYDLALPALTTLFALQLLRVLLPSFVWYLGDTVGVSYAALGPIALGTFLAAFLAEPFRRVLGSRRALIVSIGGIGLMRLIEQLVQIPAVALVTSAAGIILFTFYFPLYLQRVRVHNANATRKFGRGFLLGIVLDTAIYGAFGTLDLGWQTGLLPLALVAILVAAQWWLLARDPSMPEQFSDVGMTRNLPLVAIGPFIFLMELIFQNIARATTLTGFPPPLAFGLIMLANAIGLVAALFPLVRERSTGFAIFVGVIFLAILASRPDPQRATADFIYFFGNLLLFPFMTLLFSGLYVAKPRYHTMWRSSIANGIGWLLFVLLAFLYYVSYEVRLPFGNNTLPFIAMALFGIAVLVALRRLPNIGAANSWTSATVAFVLLLVPIMIAINFRAPAANPGKGFPVRVMSYNLHNGFSADGKLNPDALAQTIQAANPDIIALQEVERGWLIDSNLDLLDYLSQKLNMPYVFGPTADPVWGNAILSRYPIKETGSAPLPPRTLLIKRGYMWARVDVGGDELFVVVTHFHHIDKDTEIRQQQSPEIVKFWNQRPRTIFMGDLNARPDSKEIAILSDAGLQDAFAEAGTGTGFTWNSAKPDRRIDYLWLSPDLSARDFFIPISMASDHYGVAATVGVK